MTHIGNIELLSKAPITGVLASRLINTGSVIPALDWAISRANNPQAIVMSGSQSTIEKKILRYLLTANAVLYLSSPVYLSYETKEIFEGIFRCIILPLLPI